MLILVLVLVLKDSLRTFFKSLSLSWSLGVRSQEVLVLVLVLVGQVLVLVLVLGGQVLVNIPVMNCRLCHGFDFSDRLFAEHCRRCRWQILLGEMEPYPRLLSECSASY